MTFGPTTNEIRSAVMQLKHGAQREVLKTR
jgi:hypothetical protein